ncbi:hypothetical protein KAZ66_00580 [Candidatus Woesebacteria bacterium]|nr:hypothetical protein [Candidatus Woesebacteria bacterium]
MGETMMLLGVGLMILAVFIWGFANPKSGLGKRVYATFALPTPKWVERRLAARDALAEQQLAEFTKPVDRDKELRQAKVNSFATVMGTPLQIKAKVTLLELKFLGKDKANKSHTDGKRNSYREFPTYLVGKQLLLEQPMKEEGSLSWFLYKNMTLELEGFSAYLKGSEASPGPGVLFAQSDQQGTVYIEALGKKYRAMDLLWADLQIEEGEFFLRNSSNGAPARVVMLLARCEDDGEYLLSIDLRSGEGSDTVWVGRPFDPNVEIEDI